MKPDWSTIERLTVTPTEGELFFLKQLDEALDETYDIFFNPFLDGDRPDIIIIKKDYGAVIVEVKDWNLDRYTLTNDNQWIVKDSKIRSPHAQVFRYKQNMFELHLPVLGLRELHNKNFYNVIETYVYFHESSKNRLKNLYGIAEEGLKKELDELNQQIKNKKIAYERYDKKQHYLSNKAKQLSRDCRMSVARDSIRVFLDKILKMSKCNLFTNDIYQDFIRRLSPPIHVLEQGLQIKFDKKQEGLTKSLPEQCKIKGVAGCGKTTIMAKRAINAHERHKGAVLILTYNITLRHYIRDKISQILGRGADNHFEIMHYHGFINNKINEHGVEVKDILGRYRGSEKEKLFKLYCDRDVFDTNTYKEKYKTIFIDEVQDYEPDWIKNIRDNFLEPGGEMILFGDQSQNIYERDDNKRESALVQGFGRWIKLTKSYRSNIDTPLVQLFKRFQEKFLVSKYADSELFESTYVQGGIQFDLLAYERYGSNINFAQIFQLINAYVKDHKIHPNDMVIICSKVEPLVALNELFTDGEKTKIMFEDQTDLQYVSKKCGVERSEYRNKEIDRIRRRKKCFFMQNSGVVKLSTIHSYKGLESDTVFCILLDGDHEEMVYTGITRAKTNLVIFDCEQSNYREFFAEKIR